MQVFQSTLKDNISFLNFGYGMQAYTVSGELDNLIFENNALFSTKLLTTAGTTYTFLIGHQRTGKTFTGLKFRSNYLFGNPPLPGHNFRDGQSVIAWNTRMCISPEITGNYLVEGVFDLGEQCTSPTVTGNTFVSSFNLAAQYPSNVYTSAVPNKVFVRPNIYEQGRANIIVYNGSRVNTIKVKLNSVLSIGQRYEIRDAQNFNGPAIVTGTYNGHLVSIPMTSAAVSPVYGTVNIQPTHSSKEFGAFVVLPRS